jgi:hypothetical protein
MMAGVRITIPGTAGIVEAKKIQMAQLVQHHWNVVTATPHDKPRRPSAGGLEKRPQRPR